MADRKTVVGIAAGAAAALRISGTKVTGLARRFNTLSTRALDATADMTPTCRSCSRNTDEHFLYSKKRLLMSMFRKFLDSQIRLSRYADSLLPSHLSLDGNRHFMDCILPAHLRKGAVLIDVGGGKRPCLSIATKQAFSLSVIGFDISNTELEAAPGGIYDKTECADICSYTGGLRGDIIICGALLEHVRDLEGAFRSLARMLRVGGRLLVFVPSRNALFARLNLILPQKTKEVILFGLFPETRRAQGFPSYYYKCTPNEFRKMASENGLEVVESHFYFMSAYFTFLFPLHILWRIYSCVARAFVGTQAAESFTMVFERHGETQRSLHP
jgi:SAM-dependent methyltransferase